MIQIAVEYILYKLVSWISVEPVAKLLSIVNSLFYLPHFVFRKTINLTQYIKRMAGNFVCGLIFLQGIVHVHLP